MEHNKNGKKIGEKLNIVTWIGGTDYEFPAHKLTYAHTHTHTHTHTQMCTHKHNRICTQHVHTNIYSHAHTHTHMHAHTQRIQRYIQIHVHTHIDIHTYIHTTGAHTHTHTLAIKCLSIFVASHSNTASVAHQTAYTESAMVSTHNTTVCKLQIIEILTGPKVL